jgi:hypothetical protein
MSSATKVLSITHFPDAAGHWLVSSTAADRPRFSHDGRELYYVSQNNLMSAAISVRPAVTVGPIATLFDLTSKNLGPGSGFDVSRDGLHFLMFRLPPTLPAGFPLSVIQNWTAALSKSGS